MGKLSKNVIIYFIGNTISRFMGIIVLLISTHILTDKKDIGYFSFVSNTTNIVLTIFCLQIWMSIIRYIFDYTKIKDKLKIISTGYLIALISFLAYILVLIIYCIVKSYTIWFFLQIFFLSFSYVFNQVVQFACRGLNQNKLYVFSGIVGSFMQLFSSVVFLFVFKMKSCALILATAISYFSQGFFIEFFLSSLKRFKLKYIKKNLAKKMINYAIPTTLNSILYTFNQTAYIWLLKFFYDDSAIGIFTPASRMMSLIGLFVMSFNFAFQEYSFFMNKSKFKTKIYNKTFESFFKFISSGTIILMPLTQIFFSLMVGESYKEAKFLMPILYLSSILESVQIFFGSIMQAEKKVGLMFLSQLIGTFATILTMFLTTNLIDLQSAGVSMVICFFVVSLIRFLILNFRIKLKFKAKFLFHFIPIYLLTSFIFLKYNVLVNCLYTILSVFYFAFCNKKIIVKLIKKNKINNYDTTYQGR